MSLSRALYSSSPIHVEFFWSSPQIDWNSPRHSEMDMQQMRKKLIMCLCPSQCLALESELKVIDISLKAFDLSLFKHFFNFYEAMRV